MPHDHASHRATADRAGDRRVLVAIWANGLLTLAQVAGGIVAGSLALVADALHNLSDMAALVIAYAARRVARRPADRTMTFGYGRIELVAALVNYVTLIVIGLYLIYEGVMRLFDPPPVAGWTVVVVATVALVVDALTALLTWSMQKGSQNIRALFLHNLSDALGSVAVIVGGTLILLYDLRWVDPAITIGIAGYVLYLAVTEIGTPVRGLMLGAPPGIDPGEVVAAIRAVPGVADVHHVHLWQMQEHSPALDAHLVVAADSWPEMVRIRDRVRALAEDRFGIAHTTLELETAAESCAGSGQLFGHDEPAP